MFVILAIALLLKMPVPNLVVALKPYWSFLGSLQSSTVTSVALAIGLSLMRVQGFISLT